MFWRFGIPSASNIEVLLDKPDVTLEVILDEVDLLQECKAANQKLIDFFSKPEILEKLLLYVSRLHEVPLSPTAPPQSSELASNPDSNSLAEQNTASNEQKEKLLVKYPFLVSEIFSIEPTDLLEAVLNQPEMLNNFINVTLDLPAPLNPIQASYWVKILSNFLIKKTCPTVKRFRSIKDFISRLVRHALNNSAMMEMILKLVGIEELADGKAEKVLEWLGTQDVLPMFIERLDPYYNEEVHATAASALLDVIAISQAISFESNNLELNPLIKYLKGDQNVQRMVNYMLDKNAPNSASTLIHVINIFVELIRRNSTEFEPIKPDMQMENQDGHHVHKAPMNLSALIRVLTSHINDLQILLKTSKPAIQTSIGKFFPLGQGRLRICELLAELVRCAIDFTQVQDPTAPAQQFHSTPTSPMHIDETGPTEPSEELKNTENSAPEVVGSPSSPVDKPNSPMDIANSPVPVAESQENPSDAPSLSPSSQDTVKDSQIGDRPSSSPSHLSPVSSLAGLTGKSLQAALAQSLVDSKILVTCLDLFFSLPWNNILHGVVYDMILQILNSPVNECRGLILSILQDGQLTKRITAAQRTSDYEAQQPKGVRLGFMGHITLISEEVVKIMNREESIRTELQDMFQAEDWQEFTTKVLRETRERDLKALGGNRPNSLPNPPNHFHSATGDELADAEDEEAIDMTTGGVANDQFARYLCQRISSDLPDRFGIADDNDDDEDDVHLWSGDFMKSPFSHNKYQSNDQYSLTSTLKTFDEDSDNEKNNIRSTLWSDNSSTHSNNSSVRPETNLTPADWTADFEAAFNNSGTSGVPLNISGFGDIQGFSDDENDSDEAFPPKAMISRMMFCISVFILYSTRCEETGDTPLNIKEE